MNLEITYLILKIIFLFTAIIAVLAIELLASYLTYKSYQESKKLKAERVKKESDPQFKKEQEEIKERLGLKKVPEDYYLPVMLVDILVKVSFRDVSLKDDVILLRFQSQFL